MKNDLKRKITAKALKALSSFLKSEIFLILTGLAIFMIIAVPIIKRQEDKRIVEEIEETGNAVMADEIRYQFGNIDINDFMQVKKTLNTFLNNLNETKVSSAMKLTKFESAEDIYKFELTRKDNMHIKRYFETKNENDEVHIIISLIDQITKNEYHYKLKLKKTEENYKIVDIKEVNGI